MEKPRIRAFSPSELNEALEQALANNPFLSAPDHPASDEEDEEKLDSDADGMLDGASVKAGCTARVRNSRRAAAPALPEFGSQSTGKLTSSRVPATLLELRAAEAGGIRRVRNAEKPVVHHV